MNRVLKHSIFGVAALFASAAMADVTFFEGDNFAGRQFTVGQNAPNFRDSGFNDRAQSAIVQGGSWEVCVDRDFGGGCTVLSPGRYPNLANWSSRISSARMISAGPVATAPVYQAPAAGYSQGGITFFGAENFNGRQLSDDRSLPNLGAAGFDNRAHSAIIEGGSWEVCGEANFGGNCTVLAPGRYPTLGAWSGRISSARPAYEQRGERQRDRMRGGASATLFSGANLSGRQFTLGGEGGSDMNGQFTDRASSLRVDRGYWIFCSDSNFRGECQTFGPGEYPDLPPELDNRISSGRRISHEYPYQRQTSSR